jgi:hypothetical protein
MRELSGEKHRPYLIRASDNADPNAMSRSYEGACHCGAIRFTFFTAIPPEGWRVRACQCSFCRVHGARTISDAEGSVRFTIVDTNAPIEYRFGLRTAAFLVCGCCGTYVAAVVTTPRGRFATINANALTGRPDIAEALNVSYDGETAEQRLARRERNWTPVSAGG